MEAAEHRRTLVALAYPVYFELLAGVTAGIINMVWVARLGGAAVAAVAAATNVENLLLGVVLVAGSGTTVLVARARGAGDPAALRSAVRGGWALWAVVTPVVAVGGYLCRARWRGSSSGPARAAHRPWPPATSPSRCRASRCSSRPTSSTAS